MDKKQLWTLAQATMQALVPFYQEAMQQAIQASGVPDNWFALKLARGCAPEPFTVERVHAMYPYTSPRRFADMLDKLAQLELLDKVGENAYRLTDRGSKAVEDIFKTAHQALRTTEPLPAEQMKQLNGLFYRLVEATMQAPEPKEKWAIHCSRWTDPGENASGAAKMDQYITDLYSFRDDAHLAAWKPHNISGPGWEALTFIWRGDAHTAEELAQKLALRQHTLEDYKEALQDLAARGWIAEQAGAWQITEKGKQVRQEAEEATERNFVVGWSALSEAELAQLNDLLAQAKKNLDAAAQNVVWELAKQTSLAIFSAVQDTLTQLLQKHGVEKPGYFNALFTATSLKLDRLSPAYMSARNPYTNPTQFANVLTQLAQAGLLTPTGNSEYKPTDKANAATQEIIHISYTRLGELDILPAETLSRLDELLGRIVQACLDVPEPAGKECLSRSYHMHTEQAYAPLANIDQHLDDLNAFRDDAHLAAWKPYQVSGQAWEALTLIWRGDAHTAQELAEKLPYRGYAANDYAQALADLVSQGWMEETARGYRITEKGRSLRQKAEEATDGYFFSPWACLSDDEKLELYRLLVQLKNALNQAAPKSNSDA